MSRKTAKRVGATLWVQRGSVRPATGPPDQKVKSAESTSSTYSAGRNTCTKASPERTRRRRGSAALSPTPRRLPRGGPGVQDDRDPVQALVRLVIAAVGERGGHILEQLLDLPALRVRKLGGAAGLQAGDLHLDEALVHPQLRHCLDQIVEQVHGPGEVALPPRHEDLGVERLVLGGKVADQDPARVELGEQLLVLLLHHRGLRHLLAIPIFRRRALALERRHRLLPQRHVLEPLREVALDSGELRLALGRLGLPGGDGGRARVQRRLGRAMHVGVHHPLLRLHLDLLRLQGGDAHAQLPFQGLRLAQLLLDPAPLLRVGCRLQAPGQLRNALVELRLVLLQRFLALADGLLQLLHLAAVALHHDGQLVGCAPLLVIAGGGREQKGNGEDAFHAASVAATFARRISQSGTGFDFPFSLTGSRGTASTSEATFSYTRCETRTSPARACDSRRWARFTASPITVYSRRLAAPRFPATASPALIPMPNPTVVRPRRFRSPESCAARDWISRAQSTAACSAGLGAPQMHMAASPMNLLTVPPCAATRSTTTSKYSLSSATTSLGPSFSEMVVNPRTSRNSTETWRTSPRKARSSSSERMRSATSPET